MPDETLQAVTELWRRESQPLDSGIRGQVWIASVTLERILP